jgi:hypothetical protein
MSARRLGAIPGASCAIGFRDCWFSVTPFRPTRLSSSYVGCLKRDYRFRSCVSTGLTSRAKSFGQFDIELRFAEARTSGRDKVLNEERQI